jgi:hypothetical protein
MSNTPNYRVGVGRLVTDRYDFQNHIDGYSYRHEADNIELNPYLTIDGTQRKNVQEALTAALPYLVTPTLPDATSSVKGVIQLAGDLADVSSTASNVKVSGLRGYPITNSVPLNNDVLTYDSTLNAWKPAQPQNVFTAGGDLSGSNTSQTIVKLTGQSGYVYSDASHITFNSTSSMTRLYHKYTSSGDGNLFSIMAQDSSTGNGGPFEVRSGIGSGANCYNGNLSFYQGTVVSLKMSELSQVPTNTHRKVISLFSDISTTELPDDTGSGVVYLKNAWVDPGEGIPSGGAVLYSSDGKLNVLETSGNKFTISKSNTVYCNCTSKYGTSLYPYINYNSTDLDWASDEFVFGLSNIKSNDIVNVQFNGNLLIGGVSGIVKLVVQDDYASYRVIDQISKNSINDHISMSCSYKFDSDVTSANVGLMLQTSNASYPIQIYKPLSLFVQVIRL